MGSSGATHFVFARPFALPLTLVRTRVVRCVGGFRGQPLLPTIPPSSPAVPMPLNRTLYLAPPASCPSCADDTPGYRAVNAFRRYVRCGASGPAGRGLHHRDTRNTTKNGACHRGHRVHRGRRRHKHPASPAAWGSGQCNMTLRTGGGYRRRHDTAAATAYVTLHPAAPGGRRSGFATVLCGRPWPRRKILPSIP